MGSGIEINIAANTRDFQRGTKDVASALDQVADSLDDVVADAARAGDQIGDGLGDGARDGARKAERAADDVSDALKDVAKDADKAGRKLGDEISDGAKDATKSTDRLERSFRDVADASKRETKTAGDAMRKNVKDGADGASDAVREWGDETRQNLSETVSSFRGEAEDIVQVVQDTFGGVVSNLGPIGMAAGVAGAAGIGLIMGAIEQSKERAAEFQANVADVTAELIEMKGDPVAALETVAERLKALATESDESKTSLSDLYDMASNAAGSFDEIAQAYAGNSDGLKKVLKEQKEHLEVLDREKAAITANTKASADSADEKISKQQQLIDTIEEQMNVLDEAEANQRAADAADLAGLDAKAARMDALQGELDEAIGSWSNYYDEETGATDPSAYIANMQARMAATTNFNANVQALATQFGLTHDEVQAILDQGVEFAPMLQSILDSGMGEQYASTVRAMLDGGQSIVDGTPMDATVTVGADTTDADAKLQGATTERSATVRADAETGKAESELDQTASEKRTATIDAEVDLEAARKALVAFTNEARSTRVGVSVDTTSAEAALSRFVNQARTTVITAEIRDREGRAVP